MALRDDDAKAALVSWLAGQDFESFWVGLRNAKKNTDSWRWIATGKNLTLSNFWYYGDPDKAGNQEGVCAALSRPYIQDEYTGTVVNCSQALPFVCEVGCAYSDLPEDVRAVLATSSCKDLAPNTNCTATCAPGYDLRQGKPAVLTCAYNATTNSSAWKTTSGQALCEQGEA